MSMLKSRHFFLAAPVGLVLALSACNGGTGPVRISHIDELWILDRSSPSSCVEGEHGHPSSATCAEAFRFVEIGKEISLIPYGRGNCSEATVDFGDGTPTLRLQGARSLDGSWVIKHTYKGWPGKKNVVVKGVQGCLGDVVKEIKVGFAPDGHEEFRLGFVPNNMVCNTVPNMPPLRKGTGVRISTNGDEIIYGLPRFNASGDPNGTTPPDFPFPGMRVFSVVYQVGSQQIQGEAGAVLFRVNQTAPLEICVNDHRNWLNDNRGGMRIDITVNERSAD